MSPLDASDSVPDASSSADAPAMTVIIPTYNRRDVLARCLDALDAQVIPDAHVDVIVIDDGSSDGTAEMVAEASTRLRISIRYLRQQNAGPSAARNRALRCAAGPLALIINDDTIVSPGCLAEHIATHRANPDAAIAVLGRVTLSPDVPRTLFSDLHLDATFSTFADSEELDWRGFITCNISVKRQFLLDHGLFEESMFPHEDLELGWRLKPHGLRILYRPRALAYHYHHLTERDYLRVANQDGRALARWYRKDPSVVAMLAAIGLQGRAPLNRSLKHRLAELAIAGVSFGGATRVARVATRVSTTAGVFFYRRLYQYVRRQAIDRELETGPAAARTAF